MKLALELHWSLKERLNEALPSMQLTREGRTVEDSLVTLPGLITTANMNI